MASEPTTAGTKFINRRSAEAVLHAVRYATSIDRPINGVVTISTTLLGIDDTEAGAFIAHVRNAIRRKWIRERDVKRRQIDDLYDVIVHEHPPENVRHAHWLLHRPATITQAEFERDILKRIMRATGLDDLGSAVHFEWEVSRPSGIANYVVKGVDPVYGSYFHLQRIEDMGFIHGRRVTVSRSLGRRARQISGWNRKADRRRPRNRH